MNKSTQKETGEGTAPRVEIASLKSRFEKLLAQRDELLLALIRARMDLQDIKQDSDSGEFEIDPQFAIDRIQAAIAKAKGREQ